jgi:hypothetical protein
VLAGTLSGLPSTVHTLLIGGARHIRCTDGSHPVQSQT